MNGVIALAAGVQPLNVGALIEVNPEAAHGVVHAGEDFHGHVAGIVANELLVNLQDAFQFAVERGAVNMCQVEIDHGLAVNAKVVLVDHFVDGPGRDVTRHQVAVLGVPLFQEIPAFAVGNALGLALITQLTRHPDTSTFATRRLGHEAQLVFAGNARGMHLDEFSVGVVRALLI